MSQEEFDAGFEMEEGQQTDEALKDQEQQPEAQPPEMPHAEGAPAENAGMEIPAEKQTARISETPSAIADELERLKRLNPRAAELALEDSEEGRAIRTRLENYGAEQAQDRAEMTLYRREEHRRRAQEQQQQVEAYNRSFQDTIRREAPEFYAMSNDPSRQEETRKYLQSITGWIESKPYREGLNLMKIMEHGNANQVCAMIKQYEAEKNGRAKDADAMYAVPGRGAPAAPAGIGDKNDFDAGWNLHE